MNITSREQAAKHQNSAECEVYAYPAESQSLDGAVADIHGRYPLTGFVTNRVCRELAYVMKGSGSLETENVSRPIIEGDVIDIAPGEFFAWNGNLTLFIACSPAFDPAQYSHKE